MEEVTNSHAEGYSGSSDETNLSTSRASGPGGFHCSPVRTNTSSILDSNASGSGREHFLPKLPMKRSESADGRSTYERIYAVVRRVPRGRVATYGQIAEIAGLPGHARQVGYALHALPRGTRVPWHRVMNARGQISLRRAEGADILQRILLEQEGVGFDLAGRVSLKRFRWRGMAPVGRGRTAAR